MYIILFLYIICTHILCGLLYYNKKQFVILDNILKLNRNCLDNNIIYNTVLYCITQ